MPLDRPANINAEDTVATLSSTRLTLAMSRSSVAFNGQDIIAAVQSDAPPLPGGSVNQWFIRLYLTGDAKEQFPEGYYDVALWRITSPASWNDKQTGANTALAAIRAIIRSAPSGGGGGQVDTIVPGDAIDVDATDPVNPVVDVRVDGVTIGINGLNQLEVPAGGGGYVPTSRTISTTSPLTGGGDLSANRTFAIPQANGSTNGYLSSGDWTTFNNKGDVSGPASAVDEDIAIFDGISGKDIKSAGINLTEVVEPFGLGDVSLFHSTGVSPIVLKDVNDGDGTSVQANTGSFQINVETKNSVQVDAAEVQLVGDAASPGNRKRYGTNASGVKGWYDTDVSDLTGLGTGVSTALGQNADSASGFVTQSGGDARYIQINNAPSSATLVSVQPTASYSWPTMPAALTWFLGQARWTRAINLAGRNQMKVHVFTASTGSYVAGSKIRLLYRTQAAGYSATIGDYIQLGASAHVEVAFAIGTAYYSSGWIDIAAGAKDDIIIATAGIDGNGVVGPIFLGIGIDYR